MRLRLWVVAGVGEGTAVGKGVVRKQGIGLTRKLK